MNGEFISGTELQAITRINRVHGFARTIVPPSVAAAASGSSASATTTASFGSDARAIADAANAARGVESPLQPGTPTMTPAMIQLAIGLESGIDSTIAWAKEPRIAGGEWWFLGTRTLTNGVYSSTRRVLRNNMTVEVYVPRSTPPRLSGGLQNYVCLLKDVRSDDVFATTWNALASGSTGDVGAFHAARISAVQGGYKVVIGGSSPFANQRPQPIPAAVQAVTDEEFDQRVNEVIYDTESGSFDESVDAVFDSAPVIDFSDSPQTQPSAKARGRKKAEQKPVGPKVIG